ncbi:TolC family protein [Pleomorphovibrio marinus]|uniref:TolC family protein n=1 Tax=Pleomorphovibrio marinus TaxID=2164132 RepID=UPI0018E531E9|nr:TolC family protein [Pleomorphovibrio marinus]
MKTTAIDPIQKSQQSTQLFPRISGGLGLIAMLLFGGLSSQAQEASPPLSLYLEMAAENNPQVMGAFNSYKAQLAQIDQMGQLPDAELGIGYFLRPMQLLMGNQIGEVSLMQMFPWFGTLKAEKSEASAMAKAGYEAFREERNQVMFEVKNTYYDLLLLQQSIEITEANLVLLESLEELSLVRFQGGETGAASGKAREAIPAPTFSGSLSPGNPMDMGGASTSESPNTPSSSGMSTMNEGKGAARLTDVLRLQIQIKGLKSELGQLHNNKKPLIQKFSQLTGLSVEEEIELVHGEKIALAELEEILLDSLWNNNPMLLMLGNEADALQTKARLAELAGKPMIGLGVNYMLLNSRPEMGMPGNSPGMEYTPAGMGGNMWMPMLTLSLPIARKKYRAMESEAQYLKSANLDEQENLRNLLQTALAEILNTIQDAERREILLQEQVELLEKTLELMIVAYANDEGSFEELIAIQRELLEFRLDQVKAELDVHRAHARLASLVGI